MDVLLVNGSMAPYIGTVYVTYKNMNQEKTTLLVVDNVTDVMDEAVHLTALPFKKFWICSPAGWLVRSSCCAGTSCQATFHVLSYLSWRHRSTSELIMQRTSLLLSYAVSQCSQVFEYISFLQ